MDSKWIRVKDRLPNKGDTIIVCSQYNMCLVYMIDETLLCIEDDWYDEISDFDYWLPIPEPPKEDYNGQ